ncbi:MAG: MnmC family methyltransferase [Vampirovibrionales bacterium]|nr:MnmC family methyltransferase [Vampirovibrionales bacterium]
MTQDLFLSKSCPVYGQGFHNSAGAFTESWLQFVQPVIAGLWPRLFKPAPIVILDAYFGLGYNTWVFLWALEALKSLGFTLKAPLLLYAADLNATPEVWRMILSQTAWHKASVIDQTTAYLLRMAEDLEKQFPECTHRDSTILNSAGRFSLNAISHTLEHNTYYQTLEAEKPGSSVSFVTEDGRVRFEFFKGDARETFKRLNCEGIKVHAQFFDAFSPKVVPMLWTFGQMACLRDLLHPEGLWVSYCSANAVRGALRQAGFTVLESKPLGGKQRGGTVALMPAAQGALDTLTRLDIASQLTQAQHEQLNGPGGVPYESQNWMESPEVILERRKVAQKAQASIKKHI